MLTYCGDHVIIYVCQVIMLYTLNFYSHVCQLRLNKTGKCFFKSAFASGGEYHSQQQCLYNTNRQPTKGTCSIFEELRQAVEDL